MSALGHIFGYTVVNDVSARELQNQHLQFFKGKSLDRTCPIGPCIVTADEIPDPGKLGLRLKVNGEVRQNSNTADLIFDIPKLIEALSLGMTLGGRHHYFHWHAEWCSHGDEPAAVVEGRRCDGGRGRRHRHIDQPRGLKQVWGAKGREGMSSLSPSRSNHKSRS